MDGAAMAMPPPLRLRVVTLNVWALPWPVGRDVAARVDLIGSALPALDADLVALQEVWSERARAALIGAGRRSGLEHAWPERAAGGLLLLSRLPLANPRFEAFALRGLPQRVHHGDYWGGKGFLWLEIDTARGRAAVAVTHLHAQYRPDADDEYRPHRTGQVVQLAARLRAQRLPLVALGDFNIREGRPEYRVLLGSSGLRDVAAELGQRAATGLASNPYRVVDGGPDQRIDYVFVRDGRSARVRPRSIRRVFDETLPPGAPARSASDHAGLLAELEIAPATGVPPAPVDADSLALARRLLDEGRRAAVERRRRQRVATVAALAGGTFAAWRRRDPALDRRRLLRSGLLGAVGLALPAGLGLASLSELHAPDELRAFDGALRLLREIEAG